MHKFHLFFTIFPLFCIKKANLHIICIFTREVGLQLYGRILGNPCTVRNHFLNALIGRLPKIGGYWFVFLFCSNFKQPLLEQVDAAFLFTPTFRIGNWSRLEQRSYILQKKLEDIVTNDTYAPTTHFFCWSNV